MRVLKLVILTFAMASITVPAWAVEITPSELADMVLPTSSGELFSFDYIVSDAMGVTAAGFKSTISVTGPGALTFDPTACTAVVANTDYWIYNNSDVLAIERPGGFYEFGDGPSNPPTKDLFNGDIMARYAFTWDGTVGDYTFSLDLNTAKSYIQNGVTFLKDPLQFNRGDHPGDSSSFTVTIPEPATLMLLALGSTILLRKRRA
jgi:hypothetical protein